ncbi:MAG: hypothetical protein HY879_08990 [Deltaproteobacteria bacterium]|nr:hypothetical protein [Deltaproteobacteria bacterium]
MNIGITSEQKILQEGEAVLRKHLGTSKTARFLSAWRQGAGDYLKIKEELFESETVDSLYKKIKRFEKPGR